MGIEYLNHVPDAAKQGASLVRMTSGNIAGSRWGLSGVEDLGGGLTGVFLLEGGMVLDSGAAAQGGRLFGRRAYVGLDTPYGQVTMGRHHNLTFDLIIPFDPMLFAPKYSSYSHDSWLAGRVDNAVKYTGNFGALTASALYSFGIDATVANGSEVPGNSRVGRDMSAGFSYGSGALRFGAVYDQGSGIPATGIGPPCGGITTDGALSAREHSGQGQAMMEAITTTVIEVHAWEPSARTFQVHLTSTLDGYRAQVMERVSSEQIVPRGVT